jgi:hypothetical protein
MHGRAIEVPSLHNQWQGEYLKNEKSTIKKIEMWVG